MDWIWQEVGIIFMGLIKSYRFCIEFVKENINAIQYDIEYFLGFDVSCQPDIQIKELEKYSKHGH